MNTYTDAAEALAALNRKLIEQAVQPLTQDGDFDGAEMFRSLAAGVAGDTGRWLDIQNRYYRGQLEL